MIPRQPIRCVLSGSYHKDRAGLDRTYLELVTNGCQVLSPHRMQFVEKDVTFVRDTAEDMQSEKEIELHHLQAIAQSDFVWVHLPDGYVGRSTALEIGYSFANNIPVFSTEKPSETIFTDFVVTVKSVFDGILKLK